jgi:hypothetical protein
VLSSCETTNLANAANSILTATQGGELTEGTVIAGLKEALAVGTGNAVVQTSASGGFADNKRLRIPTPEKISKVTDTLRKVGMGATVDRFEAKMNEAAERAAGEAKPVFINAIRQMSFADARAILKGGDTAATDYFRSKTETELERRFQPVISRKMNEVGAVQVYNDLVDRYNKIPLTKKPAFTLEEYVTAEALDGLFLVLADEEKKIRRDPAARTTELLRQVFSR